MGCDCIVEIGNFVVIIFGVVCELIVCLIDMLYVVCVCWVLFVVI